LFDNDFPDAKSRYASPPEYRIRVTLQAISLF